MPDLLCPSLSHSKHDLGFLDAKIDVNGNINIKVGAFSFHVFIILNFIERFRDKYENSSL